MLAAVGARADFLVTSYTFDLTDFPSAITNLVAAEYDGSNLCCPNRMSFLSPSSGIAAASLVTMLENPFWKDPSAPVTFALLMGIVQDLPGDAPGQKHLVFGVDPAVSAALNGLAWAALFPELLEEEVIANLELATSGGLGWGAAFDTLAPGLFAIDSFARDLRVNGYAGSTEPSVIYPWFAMPSPDASATSFDLVAFSTGQIVGSGTALQTTLSFGTPVPEPATTLLVAMAGLLGLAFRRR